MEVVDILTASPSATGIRNASDKQEAFGGLRRREDINGLHVGRGFYARAREVRGRTVTYIDEQAAPGVSQGGAVFVRSTVLVSRYSLKILISHHLYIAP